MSFRRLKWLRVAVALAVFAGLTAALVDFSNIVPASLGKTLAGIQFVPSLVTLVTGAGVSVAGLLIIVITLGWGRIYCSTICPLGILQDIVFRLRRWFGRKPLLLFSKPVTWLRQTVLWAALAALAAGGGGFALALLDPYSNFGRIASDLFRPPAIAANNQLAGLAEKFGWLGLYRVNLMWPAIGTLALPALVLLAVTVLASWRGRLFCNTFCPVGTLLGVIASRAAFRIEIDPATCRKCASCVRVCKSQCIDLRAGAIDFSRCVACYDCLDVCDDAGIRYRPAWKRPAKPAPQKKHRPEAVPNPPRRAFIRQTIAGASVTLGMAARSFAAGGDSKPDSARKNNWSPAVCPPGSLGVSAFLDHCTACHLCVSACPTGVLQPATLEFGLLGFLKPRLDFARAFCNFDCRRCGEVCPDGAIRLLDVAAKHVTKIGEVEFFKNKCVVVTNGTDCASCSEHCPTKAISTRSYGKNLRLPEINADLCIGCGACEYACPAKPDKAIKVHGLYRHGVAKKLVEPQATLPKTSGDFPF
jgi:ferredoxin